nr:protein mesa [Quercus suber]
MLDIMATVLPTRPNTNSTGSSNKSYTRKPSLASFPSSASGTFPHLGSSSDGIIRSDSSNAYHDYTVSHSPQQPPSAHSQQSSVSTSAQRVPERTGQRPNRGPKLLKSQYPANSVEQHVEYILVASFDIDRGSIMEHQYPGPVGGDEHMLAELMLPDQTHLRSQDWTIFFLHKDAGNQNDDLAKRRNRRQRQEYVQSLGGADIHANEHSDGHDYLDDETSDEEQVDGPPLVYVLNLVNTKQDSTVKRGAVVKAMAICTRHSFLHIYKPLLLLALEQYFSNPVVETLASLYEAVNSMDLSLMPRLTTFERFVLQGSEAKDLFIEKFEIMIAQSMANNNSVNQNLLAPSPSTQTVSRARYGLPKDTHEFESVVKYANIPVPVKIPTALSHETVGDFSLIKLITTFNTPHATSPVPFNPTHPHITTSGPLTHPIIVLLNALLTQKRVIFLGHNLPSSEVAEAVLGACALASGGMLRGFTRHAFPYTDLTKIDDLLKVPGFIAGVTNPAFALKTEWWDLLCDLPTGRMKISNRIEQAPLTDGVVFFQQPGNIPSHGPAAGISALASAGASISAGLGGNAAPTASHGGDPTGDAAFMASVISAINERHGENAIRSKFRRWILKFTRLAAAFEETVYGASALHVQMSPKPPFVGSDSPALSSSPFARSFTKRYADGNWPPDVLGHGYVWATPQLKTNELAANAARLEGWRSTRSYYNFVQDLAAFYAYRPVKDLDLPHLHDKLAKLRLTPEHSANIYLSLCAVAHTDQEINQLLSVIVQGVWDAKAGIAGQGGTQGLFYIALGLFHPKLEVREAVAELLERIRDHEAGRHFLGGMGRFQKIALHRVLEAKGQRTMLTDEFGA